MTRALLVGLVLTALFAVSASAEVTTLKPGDKAPDFKLFGVDYRYHSLAKYDRSRAVLVVFTCNHCPVAKAYEDALVALGRKYQPKGIQFLAINPNPADMQSQDGFPEMIKRAKEKEFPFPYLYDETQEVATAYGATVTPHVFLLSPERTVLYEGAIDNRHNAPNYLSDALDAVLAGKAPATASTSEFGCSVKYRPKKEDK